ncbi:ABC-type transport auxiliary lipoprotein family protein [Massilia sp. S19_KUP03_FR1]|uniref:ABC-type transport auxiliary lipoprotein family protein n=1 Tax=Massilia sp. S19_KUP03_FR1 TaxID=3025503 RepID=UPI002FCDE1CF
MTVHKHLQRLMMVAALATAAQLAGCASSKGTPNTTYDFGPARVPAAASAAPAGLRNSLVVTDVTGSASYDSERIFYRLNYADPLQARSYANSRWSTTPLQMVTQRFKTRLAQAGAKVLSTADASTGVSILRVDVDDFIHTFTNAAQSEGEVAVRASLFEGHVLVDQKSFRRTTPAATADAGGGATALAASTDAVAADIVAWLAALPPR